MRQSTEQLKFLWSWTAVTCLLVMLFGNTAIAQNAVDKSKWPARLTYATGPVGGFGQTTGSPWASLVGTDIGVPISVEATSGFSVNILMINDNKADIAITTSDLGYQGWNGADWSQGKKLRNQRTIMVFGANVVQIYAARKSGIKTLSDINGHSANPSRRRSGSDLIFRSLMDTLGIKPSRITNQNPSDANTLLGDGRLDVAAVTGSLPHPAVSEFDATHDMAMVDMTDAQRKKFLEGNPYLSAYEIPAGAYKGVTAPIKTVAGFIVISVRADMPDSLVYALVKATFDKKDVLAGAHKSYASIDPKNIIYATVPVHPGAQKYYAEHGITLPAKLKAMP